MTAGSGFQGFHKGPKLDEVAKWLGPLVNLDPGEVAGYVCVVVPTVEEGGAPCITASETIPPELAAAILATASIILANALSRREQN